MDTVATEDELSIALFNLDERDNVDIDEDAAAADDDANDDDDDDGIIEDEGAVGKSFLLVT
jgi:hypothetical protein